MLSEDRLNELISKIKNRKPKPSPIPKKAKKPKPETKEAYRNKSSVNYNGYTIKFGRVKEDSNRVWYVGIVEMPDIGFLHSRSNAKAVNEAKEYIDMYNLWLKTNKQ